MENGEWIMDNGELRMVATILVGATRGRPAKDEG
jgi:hypothetical protein